MRLKLFAFFFFWVTTAVVNGQKGAEAKFNCLHDGYPTDGTCLCTGYFEGSNCQTRTIVNDGYARTSKTLENSTDMGSWCPPGFIGANCQPTKCVDGDSKAFYTDKSDQMISFFITYNLDMRNKTATDEVVNAVCSGFNASNVGSMLFFLGAESKFLASTSTILSKGQCNNQFETLVSNDCTNDDDSPKDCPGSTDLDMNEINNMIGLTKPNSELYIVTNYPVNKTYFSVVPQIIRKAISKKIRINVFAFSTPLIMFTTDYVNLPGYQALRSIAESTLGIFATPYDGVSSNTIGNATVSDAITAMMDLKNRGFVPSGIFKTYDQRVTPNFNLGTSSLDYYISIRTEDPLPYDKPLDFVVPPSGWESNPVINTGHWKLYHQTSNSSNIMFALRGNSINTTVDYIFYTKQDSTLYPAVSYNYQNDADSPFGNVGNVKQEDLVAAIQPAGLTISNANIYSPSFNFTGSLGATASTSLSPDLSSYRSCQFNIKLGSVNCTQSGTLFITSTFGDGTSRVTPFFCKDNETSAAPTTAAFEGGSEDILNTENDNKPCKSNGAALLYEGSLDGIANGRAFAIISRNVRYTPDNCSSLQGNPDSPVDRLYWNPNNILEYLLNLESKRNSPFYSAYYANLVNNDTDIIKSSGKLQKFIDDVLDVTNTQAACNTNDSIPWMTSLTGVINMIATSGFPLTYSDIFVVMDIGDITTISNPMEESPTFWKNVYKSRSRLYFLTVETQESFTPSNVTVDNIQTLSWMAGQTGGGLYRFKDFDNLQQFFDIFFDPSGNGLIGADTVYQKLIAQGGYGFNITTEDLNLPPTLNGSVVNYWLHLYGTTTPFQFTSTCGDMPTTPIVFGEQRRYNLSGLLENATSTSNCSFYVKFNPPFSLGVTFIIYVSGQNGTLDLFSNVAFTDSSNNEVSSDGSLLYFANTNGQYPVFSTNTLQSILIKGYNFQDVIADHNSNTSLINERSCSAQYFKTILNYNFKCTAADNIYYFYTTFANGGIIHSRSFITQCLSGGRKCANGEFENNVCICPAGYTGDICDQKVCQNGGILQPSGLCKCTDNYSGDFCEDAQKQTCSPTLYQPDTRSEVGSLIFVVEKVNLDSTKLSIPTSMPGIQLTVVQYDCNGSSTVLLGTDPSKLNAALNPKPNITCSEQNASNLEQALLTALDTQISSRALLVVLAKSSIAFQNKSTILRKIASQRVDIRIFAENLTNGDDLKLLATVGNGIVFSGPLTTNVPDSALIKYFNNYIWNVIPKSRNLLTSDNSQKIPRLSVIQSGVGSASVTVVAEPTDSSDSGFTVYYVHTSGSSNPIKVNGSDGCTGDIVGGNGSRICSITPDSGKNVIIDIPDDTTSYSIEKMTTVLLGYGVESDGFNEEIKLGLSYDVTNYISFYTSRSTLSNRTTENFPYVVLKNIDGNGTVTFSGDVYATRKHNNCVYDYYVGPISCTSPNLGYVAQFATWTQDAIPQKRYEQKVILCAGNEYFTTAAPPPTTPTPPPPSRAYAFIIDTRGGDPNLFNISQETVTDFLSAYSSNYTHIFFTSQQGNDSFTGSGSGSFVENNPQNIVRAFNNLAAQRMEFGDNNYTDLSPAFNTISKSYTRNDHIKEIIFLTQTGILPFDNTSLVNVTSRGFTVSTVLFIATLPLNDTQGKFDSLQQITANPKVANNTKDAVNLLIEGAVPPTYNPVADIPVPTSTYDVCVKKAQSSIFVSFEGSKTNSSVMDNYLNSQFIPFFKNFPSDFELGDQYIYYNYPIDSNGCNVTLSRFEAQTQMAGWVFFDNKKNGQTPNLCFSNYPSLVDYVYFPGSSRNMTPSWGVVSKFIGGYLRDECHCTRKNDTNTLKVIVWLVYTLPAETDKVYIANLTDNPFIHIVLAWNDAMNYDNQSFYYNLTQASADKANAALSDSYYPEDFFYQAGNKNDTTDQIKFVYSLICRLQGLTGSSMPSGEINTEYFESYWQKIANLPDDHELKRRQEYEDNYER